MIALLVAAALALPTPVLAATTADRSPVRVVVEATSGDAAAAAQLVTNLGGEVTSELPIIGGFAATVPAGTIDRISADPSIATIVPDGSLELMGKNDRTLQRISEKITAVSQYWDAGYTGKGIGIALIDSGVVPVDGLLTPGKIINGPDLSFESQYEGMQYLDSYGHGTHLAGIIAGQAEVADTKLLRAARPFSGIAPDAHVVSIKVAASNGSVDVSQVIAAIDWVVQHRNDNGMNIRVINLAFGTDSVQDHQLDPLSHAVEAAWHSGIVVVVAAGNDGSGSPLRNPATNPFVIAVGAGDAKGTPDPADDEIPRFSSCGTERRHVDLVAPGKSVISLRAPGSYIDTMYPEARVGEQHFVGSGTSQATAVVSGAVALVLDQRPDLTPDQVKALLMSSANELPNAKKICQGAGLLNLTRALKSPTPQIKQDHVRSTGLGSIELARGNDHVYFDDIPLTGEQDIFSQAWDPVTWAPRSLGGKTWDNGYYNGSQWSGGDWSGASWSGASWSGASWSGASWSGASWSGASWSGASWSGASWSGASWSGASWSGASWSGASWSTASWGR